AACFDQDQGSAPDPGDVQRVLKPLLAKPPAVSAKGSLSRSGPSERRSEEDDAESNADHEFEEACSLADCNAGYDDWKAYHQPIKACAAGDQKNDASDEHRYFNGHGILRLAAELLVFQCWLR